MNYIIAKEDFDKSVLKSFLESVLSGLPKEALITGGAPMYSEIIDQKGNETPIMRIPYNQKPAYQLI